VDWGKVGLTAEHKAHLHVDWLREDSWVEAIKTIQTNVNSAAKALEVIFGGLKKEEKPPW
jgi:hypothetical protein